MLVNTLGYGIIIPVIYSYSQKFGLNDFQNGMLFALFSLCQFISTPIIGRLSDKYGRKPLLLVSLIGTAVSFFMAAYAPNAAFLYIARALDGLTSGNISVASAVISDTTSEKDRAKGFGVIGASFGFGFIFGPLIATLALPFGMHMPFVIAGIISSIAVLLIIFLLKETNTHIGQITQSRLFDFSKLYHMLFDASVGKTLMITLIFAFVFGLFIFAFQTFSINQINLSASEVANIYIIFGVIGLITQMILIPQIVKKVGDKKALTGSIALSALMFIGMAIATTPAFYIAILTLFSFSNSFVMPMTQTLLSKETDAKSQGSIMGLHSSYMSLGNIFGPIIGGTIAVYSLRLPFLLASVLTAVCFLIALQVTRAHIKKESAF